VVVCGVANVQDRIHGVTPRGATLWPDAERWLSPSSFDAIAAAAEVADEHGELSTSSLDRLRKEGFLGMPIPEHLGGGGAGLLECSSAQRRLAMADPGLAIAVNMHLFSIGTAVEHWRRHHDACGLLLEAVATQGRVVASAFAEPGLAGSLTRSNCRAVRTHGGYLVTGVKTPCSLAAHCDLVCLQMQAESPEPAPLMTAMLVAQSEGLRVERTWNSLGMRASGSDTLLLDRCFVPDELVFHRCEPGAVGDEVLTAGIAWFCVTTTATYLGVVQSAVDAATAGLRRSDISYLHGTRADLATVQTRLGELIVTTLSLEAACTGLASQLDSGNYDIRGLLPVALGLKQAAVDACTHAVEHSAELLGGQAYAQRGRLARLWRDVQALRFHPPTRLASYQALGRWALGLPFTPELTGNDLGAEVPSAPLDSRARES
jgi:alkylation response protein AidB-like acyl-CoA dehydrogenase